MTYEPLHHKYRPQTFAQLVGQEAIATTLTNAIRQQKIAPAYLFTGARGTGKTSSARILAKSLNCLQDTVPTETPCGMCDVCQTISRGTALDVIEIDAASNTGVDNIRELIERAQFAPVQCRYKVYVLDEVHMLSSSSFAALLKTLEEPPARVVFVLATTDPQRVLPTIISRCQRFDFRRIELQSMVQHLTMIASKEAIDITPDALELVAQIAQGGLRDAESLLDQLSLLSGQVTIERVWDLVGAVPERDLLALAEAISHIDPIAVLEHTRRLLNYGREPLIVLQNLVSFYRDLMIAKTAPDRKDLVAVTAPTWAQMQQLAQTMDLQTILLAQTHLRSSEGQLRHSTQPRLWLEVILTGLLAQKAEQRGEGRAEPAIVQSSQATPRATPPVVNPPIAPDAAKTAAPSVAPPPLPPPDVKPVTPPNPPLEVRPPEIPKDIKQTPPPAAANAAGDASQQIELLQIWLQMLERVPPLTKGLVKEHGHLLAITGGDVRVGFSQNLLKPAQKQVERLEKAFTEVLGRTVKVKLEVFVPEETEATSGQAQEFQATLPPPMPQAPPPVKKANLPVPEAAPLPPIVPPPIDPLLPSIPTPFWEEDEVTRAAKSLATLFNGQVVDLDETFSSFKGLEDSITTSPIDDEDDTPF